MNWHQLTVEEVFTVFSSGKNGLSPGRAEENYLLYGPNEIKDVNRKTAIRIILSQFADLMIIVLIAASVISGFIGDLTDTIVILVIVFINAFIGAFQEIRAEKAMIALKKMAITDATVIRNGKLQGIPSTSLVPGDIVLLETGNIVPADLRLTEVFNLRIDESSLTGETNPVHKHINKMEAGDIPVADRKNMAYKGCPVNYGRGTGIVVATGMQTEIGIIAKLIQQNKSITPLQQRLDLFGKKLSLLVLFLCFLFFIVGWLKGEPILTMILTSVSLAVAAIPEALPAVITISLSLAAKKLSRQKTLIRQLPAVETLGSVTYICTDKTGTLTKNKMQVEEIFIDGNFYRIGDETLTLSKKYQFLLTCFLHNNDVVVSKNGERKGDSTEAALYDAVMSSNIPIEKMNRVAELPFDAGRKMMTTFHTTDVGLLSFTKGAPGEILKRCHVDDEKKLQLSVDEMAGKGERVMGFAFRKWKAMPLKMESNEVESALTFLGLAGISDPPRLEVKESILKCYAAGITPIMITGDHPLTAKNIAERTGIIRNENDLVITGSTLSQMGEEELLNKVEKIKVFARVSPEQKLQIVEVLQKRGHYVAMTGDGVNDAPSLKQANIGIAMGITGTDVTKEAADMILLDDNFSTIVNAIKEGRRIYDNILKLITYLMTTNSGELWTLLLGPLLGLPIALLPIHILWINLVTDGLPAIALSFEKSEPNVMDRPPRMPKENIFSEGRALQMVWVGLLMAGVALGAQAWAIHQQLHWQTIVFNVLCLTQMGNLLATRSAKYSLFRIGLLSNKLLMFAVIFTCLLQFFVTYHPLMQPIFKTQSLTMSEFLFSGLTSIVVFTVVEISKQIKHP